MKLQLSNSVFHKVISRMNRILRMSIDWLTWIINLTLSTYVVYVYIMPLRMPDTLTVLPYYRLLTAVIVYGNKGTVSQNGLARITSPAVEGRPA